MTIIEYTWGAEWLRDDGRFHAFDFFNCRKEARKEIKKQRKQYPQETFRIRRYYRDEKSRG